MEQAGPTWKLLPLLETTARYFREKGLESPRVDAEILMTHMLGVRRIDLYVAHDRTLSPGEVSRYREMVRLRSKGTPVQRIAGETEFYSLPLAVDDGVFIPRPETELLVDRAVEFFRARHGGEGKTALDAGTGSGAIAIALARNVPGLRVHAVDRSPAAVRCAGENARRSGVEGRVVVGEGDFVEAVEGLAGEALLIVSNPPYVTTGEMETLPVEVAEHDPREALHGGVDGLEAYGRLVPAAAAALPAGGLLLLEVSDSVADGVLRLIEREERLGPPSLARDHAGRKRIVEARVPGG